MPPNQRPLKEIAEDDTVYFLKLGVYHPETGEELTSLGCRTLNEAGRVRFLYHIGSWYVTLVANNPELKDFPTALEIVYRINGNFSTVQQEGLPLW